MEEEKLNRRFFHHILINLLLTHSQMDGRTGMAGCEILVTFLHYFGLTNFFWMMVEGL